MKHLRWVKSEQCVIIRSKNQIPTTIAHSWRTAHSQDSVSVLMINKTPHLYDTGSFKWARTQNISTASAAFVRGFSYRPLWCGAVKWLSDNRRCSIGKSSTTKRDFFTVLHSLPINRLMIRTSTWPVADWMDLCWLSPLHDHVMLMIMIYQTLSAWVPNRCHTVPQSPRSPVDTADTSCLSGCDARTRQHLFHIWFYFIRDVSNYPQITDVNSQYTGISQFFSKSQVNRSLYWSLDEGGVLKWRRISIHHFIFYKMKIQEAILRIINQNNHRIHSTKIPM